MRIRFVVLLSLAVSTRAAAQLAPVPSHQSTRSQKTDVSVVARVNGAPIRASEVEAALNMLMPLSSYHQNVKPEKLEELRSRALEGLIDEELRYQEALRLKLRVAGSEVEQALERARKAYRSAEDFEKARRQSGATLPQIRASIVRALLIQKAYDRVVTSACRVSEADAAAYFRSNPSRFIMPEEIHPYLLTIGVDAAASKEEWERARRTAQDVARKIADGASFERLAREYSTDPTKARDGDLGFVHRGRLIEEFERALSGLRAGQVTPVIQTIYGFHLLRLAEIRPAAPKTFAELKATLVKDLTEARCGQASSDWSKRLRATARIEILDRHNTGSRVAG